MTLPDLWEQGYVQSWEAWISTIDPVFVHTELRLYDELLKITGAIDAIIQFPGSEDLIIVDYKTSASASPKIWPLQGHFYHYLCKQNKINVGKRILFLQLKKNGKLPKVYEYEADRSFIDICMCAYHCYRYLNS